MKYADGGEAKPDFLDIDKDGDKKESMKKASEDKKEKENEAWWRNEIWSWRHGHENCKKIKG